MPDQSGLSPLAKAVKKLDSLPAFIQKPMLNFSIGRAVPFYATGGLKCTELNHKRAVVHLKNRRKVQNHIKGIHASAMVLLAENTSGLMMGMNIPNDKIPVIKSLTVDFEKRCSGDLTAVATISDAQIEQMRSQEKGDMQIEVILTDSDNKQPVKASMRWAWIPKHR